MQVNDGVSLGAQERELKKAAEAAGFTEIEVLRAKRHSVVYLHLCRYS